MSGDDDIRESIPVTPMNQKLKNTKSKQEIMHSQAENFMEVSESKEYDIVLGQVPHQLKLNPSKRKITSNNKL